MDMENLDNSWRFKMVISRPGKVNGKKSHGKVIEF